MKTPLIDMGVYYQDLLTVRNKADLLGDTALVQECDKIIARIGPIACEAFLRGVLRIIANRTHDGEADEYAREKLRELEKGKESK
jgi:hypothetical protein